jgi:glycosyltransferase involved in cell wall biosynthesis
MAPLARLCGRQGTTSVLDVVEVSEHLGGSRLSAIYWDSVVGTRSTPKLFDGLSVISVGLQAAYDSPAFPPTLLVPALAAWPAAPPPAPTDRAEFRLTYVGALQPRDAPELLIGAVRIAATRRTCLRLDVVGHYEGTQRGRDLVARCAADPVLRPAVRFLGSLGEAALQAQLASSDGLLLTRRDALTEVLSFPTRLVEYLAHGRPVFVSDVGDVSRYLRHGQEAILLHRRDPQRVAAAIEAVVRRDDRGAEIGRRGREAGAREFDRKVHARRLLDFAQSLHSRRAA